MLSLAACGGAAEATKEAPGASRVAVRPPIEFAFDSLDDRAVSSEATRGAPAVMTFVTTGSLSAQAQVGFLVAMSKHDAERVHYAVIALEARENRELVELYRKSIGVPFPVAMADARTLEGAGAFGDMSAVPVTVVLDRAGRIAWRADGRVAKSDEIRAAMRGL